MAPAAGAAVFPGCSNAETSGGDGGTGTGMGWAVAGGISRGVGGT